MSPIRGSFFMRRLVQRSKQDGLWCSIYALKMPTGIWIVGLIINKSKRASNDWFDRRRNKRFRRALTEHKVKTLSQMRVCYQNIVKLLNRIPTTDYIFIENDFPKAQALSKYVERLGFIRVQQDEKSIWVLTAHRRKEDQHRFSRTN